MVTGELKFQSATVNINSEFSRWQVLLSFFAYDILFMNFEQMQRFGSWHSNFNKISIFITSCQLEIPKL